MNILLFLKNIPLFQGLGLDELLSIESHFVRQNFLSGEVVFRQGDMGTDFYIIYQGNVDIKIHKNNQDVIVATLGEGEYFGEIALFDNQPRTATVVAHNDCILLRLSQKVFLDLARQRPEILLNICRVLSQRLRDVEKKT